jgi:outer membrane protein TolC
VAETAVRQAEDRLRLLIFDATRRDVWNVPLDTTDLPPVSVAALDVDSAVTRALTERTDLRQLRDTISTANAAEKLAGNQNLPDVRANASYQASGLGGTEVLRTGGFPGTILGPGAVTPFGSVLDQLFRSNYPTWSFGVSVSYPIGGGVAEANHARARLEVSQAEQRVKSAEARAIQQVRDAAWKVEMNAKRLDTTQAARDLAEQRLSAEQKRYEVGMSTSFLVIQAQRDLAQAKQNELSAILSYDLSLVDFETLQQAGPATAGPSAAPASTQTTVPSAAMPAAAPASVSAPSTVPAGIF